VLTVGIARALRAPSREEEQAGRVVLDRGIARSLVDVALKAVETSARALDVLVAEAVPFGNDPCLPATTIFLADRPRPCDVRLMAT
jgi:hypothetical protein